MGLQMVMGLRKPYHLLIPEFMIKYKKYYKDKNHITLLRKEVPMLKSNLIKVRQKANELYFKKNSLKERSQNI